MFLRVGLQAKNNVQDRMRYYFRGLKGVKIADLASLILHFLSSEQQNAYNESCASKVGLCDFKLLNSLYRLVIFVDYSVC